jgi:prepilin-type N-terminal cleavage/methylation domain-containing protein
MRTKRNGFTLIELLTVIAIIAVIAAILFPVFGRVRESTRQTTCMANMHSLWVAAQLYKQDYNVYPCMLLGPPETAAGYAWVSGDAQPPVPASRMTHAYLYPNYVKSIDVFHCPDNPTNDLQKTTSACLAPGSPLIQFLIGQNGHDEPHIPFTCVKNLDPNHDYSKDWIQFYQYDSYDITSAVQQDGSREPTMMSNVGCYIVYWKKWTLPTSVGTQDASNQLLYPSAPTDRTVLTWCNYHVTTAHGDKSPVIFTSGTVKPKDYKQVLSKGWDIASIN